MANKNRGSMETEDQRKYRELVEGIANNIAALARSVQSLLNGPLKRQGLVILLASSSNQPQDRVKAVLSALENLDKDWLK